MIVDELSKDFDALVTQQSAPRPRVEGERVALLAKEHPGHIGLATIRDLALDLLDERAEVSRLTAEVERWKADVKQADRERGEALAEYERMMAGRNIATADLESATAEVERLTKEKAEAVAIAEDYQVQAELFAGDGVHLDPTLAALRARLAALSLPTPAPEAPNRFVSGEQVMEHYVEGYQRPPAPEATA